MSADLDRVQVRSRGGDGDWSYSIVVGKGLLNSLGERVGAAAAAHRYFLVADDNVAALYGDAAVAALGRTGARVDLLTFPAGEASKTRERWADLTDRMLAMGGGRDAAVVALGGGVTGDLAGFVAATYMRGLPLVQLPTSLLAMIDSSIGGKTGVDVPAGKNLVGTFLQPRLVLIDVDTLRTLPERELRSGLAEAIKHGAIADAAYLAWIESSLPVIFELEAEALAHLISTSVRIKAAVVERDERESGPRKMLNFGHTIGHSVESLSGFRLAHGEAIAIGMVVEAEVGERVGVTAAGTAERLRGVLASAGLPVTVPESFAGGDVVARTRSDKKARGGRVEYALLRRAGEAGWGDAPEDDTVLAAIERCHG